jgi:hypothetical protein
MRRMLFAAGLTLALAGLSSATFAQPGCEAYAHNRRVTGTVVGAVAAHGVKTEGALLGAGVGAVAGNQLSRVHCPGPYAYHPAYYHHYAPAHAAYPRYAATPGGVCRYESRPYYDEVGRLMYAPTQVCD